MKPSNAEIEDIAMRSADTLYRPPMDLVIAMAKELHQRRQQPASVPAELVEQIAKELQIPVAITGGNIQQQQLQDFANRIAAAYGREQAQQSNVKRAPVGFRWRHKGSRGWTYNDHRASDDFEREHCDIQWLVVTEPADVIEPEPPTC